MLSVIQVAAATAEPVSVLEAKNHLRVLASETSDDGLISALVAAAREGAETYCRRSFMLTQYKLVLDQFPRSGVDALTGNWWGPVFGISPGPLVATRNDGTTGFEIFLPFPPLVSVDSIKYVDDATGTQTTLAASEYSVDAVSEPARITPAYGKSWPATRNQAGAVEVTFTAGYATQVARASGNTLQLSGPQRALAANDVVRFANSGGALPAPLQPLTDYYVLAPSAGAFTVAASSGGAAIVLADAGTGTHYAYSPTLGFIPAAVRAWMLIRVGSLYQNREEVAIINRGTVEALPFVAALMGPHRVVRF
jgi:hypothetical protein